MCNDVVKIHIINSNKNSQRNITLNNKLNSSLTEKHQYICQFEEKAEQHLNKTKEKHHIGVLKLALVVSHKFDDYHGINKIQVQV